MAAIPGVGPIAAAAYLGATGGYDIANGNVVGGLADIAGGLAGVGGLIGGATGSAIQDAATVTQYGDQAYGAANSGNVWGVINAAAGAVPGITNLASDLGASTIAPIGLAAIPGVGPIAADAYLGATGGYDIANGDVAAGLTDVAGSMAGVGGSVGDAVGSALQDAATIAQYGDQAYSAVNSGNVAGLLNAAGGFIGGAAGSALQDAATAAQYGDQAYSAVDSGNVAGLLNAAGGFIGGATGSALQDAATVARYGDQVYGAVQSGNVAGLLNAAGGFIGGATGSALQDAASAVKSGNLTVKEAVSLVSLVHEILTATSVGQAGDALSAVVELQNRMS